MPDYPYEQLGDQRFQQFCQSLLTEEFPRLQSLPVAQPDGGRDALLRLPRGEALIYQIKFARKPTNLADPEQWVYSLINAELPKINQLVKRGATEYKLITNLSSTAHLGAGSLDRVQRALESLVPIPTECWWRDDLNRRLDNAFDLKLAYPELFTGNDFIRLLVERTSNDAGSARRQRALKAFVADQYEREREVRFKQAELSNDLLSVFIDVPAAPERSEADSWNSPGARLVETMAEIGEKRPRARRADELRDPFGAASVGAGSLLLDERFPAVAPCVVIEGAPGQGKSTMLQYVCQVHRLRLLDKPELTRVSGAHAITPVRLPLKVDLRDLAQWLTGRDASDQGYDVPPHLRSLEGFLSAQITAASGGAVFDVGDLHAALTESKVLLALDGLDEVVDIRDRGSVIDAIMAGVRRLQPIASSLQVVVTSRPASFVGAGGFPEDAFQQLRLRSISRGLIDEYAAKWMSARKLEAREREELEGILDAKLKLPHIRDLAHNPMQLAILLNLVHRRGRALPDQRTALYSSYMEIFLDREADKSHAVRDHRELLMTLHGHIAWLLHCQAEQSGQGGRFATDKIERVVEEFLVSKGYEPNLFGNLFGGVFDRVGALVSRVQGTYEFEVQPLREFFTARYLYQTAPYSVAGKTRRGTRPERFDAMSRHPYWLNVTRFYAGSYDIGELSSLADRLSALRKDPVWGLTAHPRMVTAQLLADWTFQQDMSVQGRVIAPLAKDLKTRGSASDHQDPYSTLRSSMVVPGDCGGDRLASRALQLLRRERRSDRRSALAAVINAQIPNADERKNCWREGLKELVGGDRDRWFQISYELGLNHCLDIDDLGDLGRLRETTVDAILYAEQFQVFDDDGTRTQQGIEAILRRPEAGQVGVNGMPHPLSALSQALRLDNLVRRGGGIEVLNAVVQEAEPLRQGYEPVYGFVEKVHGTLGDDGVDWMGTLGPWNSIVEKGRSLFGDQPALTDLAIVAAGIPDTEEKGRGHGDLFDSTISLCLRARHARMRSGDPAWWEERIGQASSEEDLITALALAWSWGAGATLERLAPLLIEAQRGFDDRMTTRLLGLIARSAALSRVRAKRLDPTQWLGGKDGPATFACTARRMPDALAMRLIEDFELFRQEPIGHGVLDRLWTYEARLLTQKPQRWEGAAATIVSRTGFDGDRFRWFPI